MKELIEMKNWSFETYGFDQRIVRLKGFIHNHPKLGDVNDVVMTSAIVRMDLEKKEVETMNTIYKLVD